MNPFAKLKADLAPMTFRQKLDHLWTYYKWVLALVIGLAVLLNIVVTALISANTEILLSGIAVNAPVDEAGVTALSSGYHARLGGTKGQEVQFLQESLDREALHGGSEAAYSAIVKISGLTSLEMLDYLILDADALEYYNEGDLFLDLRKLFTEEELSHMPVTSLGGVPMVIDITESAFVSAHIPGNGPYYLAFVYSTPHPEGCRALYQYLLTNQ